MALASQAQVAKDYPLAKSTYEKLLLIVLRYSIFCLNMRACKQAAATLKRPN